MNWFKRTNKNEGKKSENKSAPNNETQKEIEPKERNGKLENIKEEFKTNIENSDSISKKRELVEQEYNDLVSDLMISKRELKNIMQDIQKSNSEYVDLVSKIKSARAEIFTVNNELKEKNEEKEETMKEYEKLSLIIHEINNSKKELVETKTEIEKYHKELESVKIKVDESPELNSLRQEKKKLKDEILKKRKEVESNIRELKFVENKMRNTNIKKELKNYGNGQESSSVIDAASAVVASMNQKLQNTMKELAEVKKALENERRRQKN